MLGSAFKALSQMMSPPFRAVLLKSMGTAVILLIVIAIGLQRLIVWLTGTGGVWLETTLGPSAYLPLSVLLWIFSVIATLGLVFGAVFLMPTVTALVASLFGDQIAAQVERTYYPTDLPGTDVAVPRALWEGVKIALLTILIYLCAMPFLLFAGFGLVIFFFANAYLLGRQYFELAAMRFHPAAEAKALRKAHQGTVLAGGVLIAAFVSIPIVNLATPLFGTAFMVHVHKRLSPRRELIEPGR